MFHRLVDESRDYESRGALKTPKWRKKLFNYGVIFLKCYLLPVFRCENKYLYKHESVCGSVLTWVVFKRGRGGSYPPLYMR